jgi:hypothetical protein
VNWLVRRTYIALALPGVDETVDYLESECGRFLVNKAAVDGRLVYTAIRLGTAWRNNRGGWDGSEIIHVERELDPIDQSARAAAMARCKAACDARALGE